MNTPTRQERYRGAMLGLAAGDALGATVEFKSPGTFEPVTEIAGGGYHRLEAGQWTDDTSLALCLAESLLECAGFDPIDQARRYTRWYREGYLSSTGECFDIGTTTRQALESFRKTGVAQGPSGEWTAGNGSLMRLAPIPLFYAHYPAEAIALSAESSRVTHGAQTAVDACRYFGALIIHVLDDERKDDLLAFDFHSAVHPQIREIVRGSFREKEPPEIRGTGHVVRCLEAALWAFHKSDNFVDGARLAVNLGDDADTTGAVYGQIAGAYYGEKAIPEEWRAILAFREMIEDYADRLAACAPA